MTSARVICRNTSRNWEMSELNAKFFNGHFRVLYFSFKFVNQNKEAADSNHKIKHVQKNAHHA
jgi:hypothetical protein